MLERRPVLQQLSHGPLPVYYTFLPRNGSEIREEQSDQLSPAPMLREGGEGWEGSAFFGVVRWTQASVLLPLRSWGAQRRWTAWVSPGTGRTAQCRCGLLPPPTVARRRGGIARTWLGRERSRSPRLPYRGSPVQGTPPWKPCQCYAAKRERGIRVSINTDVMGGWQWAVKNTRPHVLMAAVLLSSHSGWKEVT